MQDTMADSTRLPVTLRYADARVHFPTVDAWLKSARTLALLPMLVTSACLVGWLVDGRPAFVYVGASGLVAVFGLPIIGFMAVIADYRKSAAVLPCGRSRPRFSPAHARVIRLLLGSYLFALVCLAIVDIMDCQFRMTIRNESQVTIQHLSVSDGDEQILNISRLAPGASVITHFWEGDLRSFACRFSMNRDSFEHERLLGNAQDRIVHIYSDGTISTDVPGLDERQHILRGRGPSLSR